MQKNITRSHSQEASLHLRNKLISWCKNYYYYKMKDPLRRMPKWKMWFERLLNAVEKRQNDASFSVNDIIYYFRVPPILCPHAFRFRIQQRFAMSHMRVSCWFFFGSVCKFCPPRNCRIDITQKLLLLVRLAVNFCFWKS